MLNWLRKLWRTLVRILMFTIKLLFTLAIIGVSILLLARLITTIHSRGRIYATAEDAPHARVAVVFGAGLYRDGSPTPVLRDRVQAASGLYFQGKVEKILMSGDNRFDDYDEPSAMLEYAVGLGVPADDIVRDYAGRSTYDTCYRANAIFGVEEAILVTQEFHLPRALYLCDQLGVESTGVSADLRYYLKRSRVFWNIRETLATVTALWDVHVAHPLPVLGEFEPIFTEE
jgi:SanA protein